MVELSNITHINEVQDMVRRDPGFRDSFPDLNRHNRVATDQEREMFAVPSHARLNIPLCLSIEELRDWSERLFTLAQKIKTIAAENQETEISKLHWVKHEVNRLNKESLPAIRDNRRRFYERKAVEK